MPYWVVLLPRAGVWLNVALEVYVIWLVCFLFFRWAEGWTRVLLFCFFMGTPLTQLQSLLPSEITALEWVKWVAGMIAFSVALLLLYRAKTTNRSE